jgi:hypothetical protein
LEVERQFTTPAREVVPKAIRHSEIKRKKPDVSATVKKWRI